MNKKTRLKVWFLSVQDNFTVVLLFATILLFWCFLDHCSSSKPSYEDYTQKAEIIDIKFKYLYTHSGWNDAVPKINGTNYELFYRINGTRIECEVFVKDYSTQINNRIESGNFDALEIRCNPYNIFEGRVFLN